MKPLNKPKLKKLNSMGIGHHMLIAIMVISIIAGFGAYRVWKSSAASTYQYSSGKAIALHTSAGCALTGRKWNSAKNQCDVACISSGHVLKVGNLGTKYCVSSDGKLSHIQEITGDRCAELGRIWVGGVGCARHFNQTTGAYAGAKQCIYKEASYVVPENICKVGATATASQTTTEPADGPNEAVENEIFRLHNVERAKAPVPCAPLKRNTNLDLAARRHSWAMARADTQSHQVPGELALAARFKDAGYTPFDLGAENIASNRADDVAAVTMSQWMYSTGHKANILDCRFKEIGIGAVYYQSDSFNRKLYRLTADFGAK